jgi:hypothetical protein
VCSSSPLSTLLAGEVGRCDKGHQKNDTHDMIDSTGDDPEELSRDDVPQSESSSPSDITGGTGWDNAAFALHSIQLMNAPMLVMLEPDGFPPVYIDFPRRVFHWRIAMEDFPVEPLSVRITTEAVAADAPNRFRSAGRSIDKLLWSIGQSAFRGSPAPWLRPGERYRLTSWPNFTELNHTFDHMRMTAHIGNAPLSASELAAAAASDPAAVQRMINAYSLLGILKVSEGAPATTAKPTPEHTKQSGGFIARLRNRWGL